MTPLMLSLLAGRMIEIPFWNMMIQILWIVSSPDWTGNLGELLADQSSLGSSLDRAGIVFDRHDRHLHHLRDHRRRCGDRASIGRMGLVVGGRPPQSRGLSLRLLGLSMEWI